VPGLDGETSVPGTRVASGGAARGGAGLDAVGEEGAEGAAGANGGAGAGPGAVTAGNALVVEPTLAPSPSAITATTVLMGTVAPGSTRISLSTPEAGAGISASTLSVEISNSGSSRWTRSPTFFIHFVIVPSAIDSPIWGMMTSVIASHPDVARGRSPQASIAWP
jgi:hypothetical protein